MRNKNCLKNIILKKKHKFRKNRAKLRKKTAKEVLMNDTSFPMYLIGVANTRKSMTK